MNKGVCRLSGRGMFLAIICGLGGLVSCSGAGRSTAPGHAFAFAQSPPHLVSKPALRTVPHVDLPRYMGDWRVIANIPYFAERDAHDSVETYALRPDGKIANTFVFRRGSWEAPVKRFEFTARVVDRVSNAEWRVRFLPLLNVAYLIIDLDPEYRWTVVGHPSRRYGWIMARERTLPDDVYAGILERLASQGYDPARFVKVPQVPPAERAGGQ